MHHIYRWGKATEEINMATSGGKRGALRVLAFLAIVGVAIYLLILAALHFLRPDVNPVTEPISTYGSGAYAFLFTAGTLGSAVAALALTLGLYLGMVLSARAYIGLFSLVSTASLSCWRASSR